MAYASPADLKQRKPFRWWHEAIIDDMLAFPSSSLADRSLRLRYSVSYLSIIINSDMFRTAYAARRKAFSERLDAAIQTKTAVAANKAMDILLESLEKRRDALPFQQVADFADKTLSRLGYGAKPAPPVSVHVDARQQQLTISPEDLREARKALRATEMVRAIESARPSGRVAVSEQATSEEALEPRPALAEEPGIETRLAAARGGAIEELA